MSKEDWPAMTPNQALMEEMKMKGKLRPVESETLEAELAHAKAELQMWHQRFDDYNGNNPAKFQKEIRRSAERVRALERATATRGQ